MKKSGDLYKILHLCPSVKRDFHVHQNNNFRIAGRYIFNPVIFNMAKDTLKNIKVKDVTDWDIFNFSKKYNTRYYAIDIKNYFLDMGTPETYAKTMKFLFTKGNKYL